MEENFKRTMMCRLISEPRCLHMFEGLNPFRFFFKVSFHVNHRLMIHMKCQDYSLKKIKVKLFSTAVVIGALRVKWSYTFYTLGHFFFFISAAHLYEPPITTAADNNFDYFIFFFFFIYHRKQVLAFHVNRLGRQFTWNVNTCFLWK